MADPFLTPQLFSRLGVSHTMKASTTPHKILLPLLSLALLIPPGSKAQETNPPSNNQVPRHHHELANLTDAERQELHADHQKIRNNEQLIAAKQALKEAQTPEAKKAAHQALRKIRDQLLLQVDPAVKPILEKLHQCE